MTEKAEPLRTPRTRSVQKTGFSSVNVVTLQKTFASFRRYYSQIFVKIKNPNNTDVTVRIKVGAFLARDTDTITEEQIVYSTNVTIPAGDIVAFTVTSPIFEPQSHDPYFNKWIKLELSVPLDVQVFQYSESEV